MGHDTARRAIVRTVLAFAGVGLAFVAFGPARPHEARGADNGADSFDEVIVQHGKNILEEGRQTFRHDTFGSERFWGDTLQLHKSGYPSVSRVIGFPAGGASSGFAGSTWMTQKPESVP